MLETNEKEKLKKDSSLNKKKERDEGEKKRRSERK